MTLDKKLMICKSFSSFTYEHHFLSDESCIYMYILSLAKPNEYLDSLRFGIKKVN
jgi:hypothetical protein